MNKTTVVLYFIVLSLSGFIYTFLRAEERGIYDNVSAANESRYYRVNERGGRTRSLAVSGALLSSPCTLVDSEVPLGLRPENHSASARTPLMLKPAGCEDDGVLQPGRRGVAITISGSLVTDSGTGSALLPGRKLSGCDHLVIYDGDTFLLYRPARQQKEMLAAWRKGVTPEGGYSGAKNNPATLHLNIRYKQGNVTIESTGALLLFATLSAGQAMVSDVVFRGNLLDRPCYVSDDGLSKYAAFKTRASRDFWYPPGHSPTESFVIRLEGCHATAVGKVVTLIFKGTEGVALSSHLKITGVNAGWLGIALLDTGSNSLLKSGASHSKGRGERVTGDSLEFPFDAYVMVAPEVLRTKNMVPGDYEAIATFELTYRQQNFCAGYFR